VVGAHGIASVVSWVCNGCSGVASVAT
jgi:hypothetical protein